MNFRKGEVDNHGLHTRGELYRLPASMNFFIKGIGIHADKRCCDERLSRRIVARKKTLLEDDGEISLKPETTSRKTPVHNQVLEIDNKTGSCQMKDNDIERWPSKKPKEMNKKISPSVYGFNILLSGVSPDDKQLRLTVKNHTEPKYMNLFHKYGGIVLEEKREERQAPGPEKGIRNTYQGRMRYGKRANFNVKEVAAGGEKLTFEDAGKITEENIIKQSQCRMRNAVSHPDSHVSVEKGVKPGSKRYIQGTRKAEKLKARLNCLWSRGSNFKTLEDEDYQEIDIEQVLRIRGTFSSLSYTYDDSVIDLVAKENSVKMPSQQILPPVYGSKWRLKNRYLSELSFNNFLTPVLREYSRLSQARAVDFSDDIHLL